MIASATTNVLRSSPIPVAAEMSDLLPICDPCTYNSIALQAMDFVNFKQSDLSSNHSAKWQVSVSHSAPSFMKDKHSLACTTIYIGNFAPSRKRHSRTSASASAC